jgi:hypothetical protein
MPSRDVYPMIGRKVPPKEIDPLPQPVALDELLSVFFTVSRETSQDAKLNLTFKFE